MLFDAELTPGDVLYLPRGFVHSAAAQQGDLETGAEIEKQLLPLYKVLGITTNPIPVKAALAMLGLDSGRLRLPMVEASEAERQAVRAELTRLDLLGAVA